ncbi:chlorohydrolase [Streptococcus pneumoniae]|nr:chlorohydrolase [Streptococcus pneumoniae]
MKIKDQTRKLASGCSKPVLRLQIALTWFEEIFEEYYSYCQAPKLPT